MSLTKANYEDIEVLRSGLQFLRDELSCGNFAVSVLKCDPGWNSYRWARRVTVPTKWTGETVGSVRDRRENRSGLRLDLGYW
jgi:hypothetical protein